MSNIIQAGKAKEVKPIIKDKLLKLNIYIKWFRIIKKCIGIIKELGNFLPEKQPPILYWINQDGDIQMCLLKPISKPILLLQLTSLTIIKARNNINNLEDILPPDNPT